MREPLTIDVDATKRKIKSEYNTVKNFINSHHRIQARSALIQRIMAHDYSHITNPDSRYQELLRHMQRRGVLVQKSAGK